jgi:cellulose synthase/poly-beta-1,6-N-acetylglucosamine synthase-like glycosyltransferase
VTVVVQIVFWISLAVILYTYAGYPLLIAAAARVRPRRWARAPWPIDAPAPISVVMAVHNGARMLPAKLDHLLTLDPQLVREVIVISDGSTDATANLLLQAERARTDSRLRTTILERQVGKASALNHGIAAATGEIILFVDIRPRIVAGALDALLSNFADPAVGCVAGELLLSTDGHDATASAVSGLYWRYEQWIRNCEAAFDSPTGVYGGFYAIRRSIATPNPDGLILDDMFQPLSIIRQGYRSVVDRTAHVIDIWPSTHAGEFNRKLRTLAGNFQLVSVAPWLLTLQNRLLLQLVSHKLLRLVVPYLLFTLLLSSAVLAATTHSVAFAIFGILQCAFWFMAALALRVRIPVLHRLAAPASALLLLNVAAVAGLYKYLFTRGPLWKIWSPTPTTNTSMPRSPQPSS